MKSMLLLTDFSENAFRAAEYACGLTGQCKSTVLFYTMLIRALSQELKYR
jgi:hypothetical protein